MLSGTIGPETAAARLLSLSYKYQDTPWALWNLIYEAVAEFVDKQVTLLSVLIEAQAKLKDEEDDDEVENGTPRKWLGSCFGSIWRDKFDMYWAERYRNTTTATEWININSFSARLLASSFQTAPLKCILEIDPDRYFKEHTETIQWFELCQDTISWVPLRRSLQTYLLQRSGSYTLADSYGKILEM